MPQAPLVSLPPHPMRTLRPYVVGALTPSGRLCRRVWANYTLDRANAARSQVLNDVNSSYSATHEATAISLDHTHTTGPGESGTERLTKDGKPKDEDATSSELADRGLPHPASGTGGGAISDIDAAEADGRRSVAEDELPLLCDEDEGRILSEIESGILDPFSDSYCNRHLVYGVLELILVRLMPELAERGVIELWEERLS
ncbi:hypothetical protein BJ170DRAFT_337527 [Xylariales sp. AK1849]|nr:hypothetical protein BJ170DRAFT_337527 [Xylariales sp. AK1849]